MIAAPIRQGVRRLFRLALHLRRLGRADARAELESVLEARTEQLIASGMSLAEARIEAVHRLGGSIEQALHDLEGSAERREERMRLRDLFDDLRDDVRFAVRGLRRDKVMASFIVVTLALGIGANAAMFSAVDRLLLRGPEGVADPSRVMRFYRTRHTGPNDGNTGSSFGWVSYDNFKHATHSFASAAAYSVNRTGITFGSGADAVLIPFGAATYDLFPLLGVRPQLGRFFGPGEDSPDAPQHVVVIGDALWTRAFGRDADVIGHKIKLGDEDYTVIGVAPPSFTGPQLGPVDAWIPMSLQSRGVTDRWTASWNSQWLRIIARLKPGVSAQQASADATAAYRAAYGGNDPSFKAATLWVAPLSFDNSGHEATEMTIVRWLVGVTAVVLLIACSNVANLLLARAVRRRREIAVRIALGAGRGRLTRLLLTESLLLAGFGAGAGLMVAWATSQLLRKVLLPGIEWPSAPVDLRVLGVSLAIAVAVGLVTGLAPAIRASRPDLTASLKAGARDGGGQTSRLRGALTISQAALSLVLLTGAGLFVRSLMHIRAIDLGFQPDRVLMVQVRYPAAAHIGDPSAVGEIARRRSVYIEAMRRARQLPGVEDASLSVGLPFQSSFGQFLRIPGWDSIPEFKAPGPSISAVAPDYFETLGSRLLEGRTFTAADRDGSEAVAIVSRAMARTFWHRDHVVGECLYWSNSKDSLTTCSRIVGVVADAHAWGLKELPAMNYYVPFGQERGMGGTALLVRPKPGHEVETTRTVRALLLSIDPSISFVNTSSMQDAIDPQVRPWRLGAAVFSLMGVLALVVAAVGLYSVMSYLVAQRTREIGVRLALGAQARSIVLLVLRNSVSMAAVGVAIGLVIVLWAGRFIAPLLFDTSPRDTGVLLGGAATLLAVSVLASAVPALRAKRVNPIEALRSD
jgi:predicted permease